MNKDLLRQFLAAASRWEVVAGILAAERTQANYGPYQRATVELNRIQAQIPSEHWNAIWRRAAQEPIP